MEVSCVGVSVGVALLDEGPAEAERAQLLEPSLPPKITFPLKRETRAVIVGVHSCAAKGDVGANAQHWDTSSVPMMLHLLQMGHMFLICQLREAFCFL